MTDNPTETEQTAELQLLTELSMNAAALSSSLNTNNYDQHNELVEDNNRIIGALRDIWGQQSTQGDSNG